MNDLVAVLSKEQAQFILAILEDATIKGRHARLLCGAHDAIAGARSFAQLMRAPEVVPTAAPAEEPAQTREGTPDGSK